MPTHPVLVPADSLPLRSPCRSETRSRRQMSSSRLPDPSSLDPAE